MPLPKVSCICLTFGRPSYLEEALESYLRQDYGGESELLIVNDFPGLELTYPGDARVTIVNCPERFPCLGAKRNFAIGHASGDVIMTWDDDDISLPGRIRRAAAAIGSGIRFFRPSWSWLMIGDKAPQLRFRAISWPQCAYLAEVFRGTHGYPGESGCEDRLFAESAEAAGCPVSFASSGPEDANFIYRMLPGNPHASGISLGKYTYADIPRRLQQRTREGRIVLQPVWRRDYAALCRPPSV